MINRRQADEFRMGRCGEVAVRDIGILPAEDLVARFGT
jgi:hypothetical protein